MGEIALPVRISDLVNEYDEKNASVEAAISDVEKAFGRLDTTASIFGAYGGPVTDRRPYLDASTVRKVLLKSAWKAVYGRMQIDSIASATDKQRFERAIEDPAPFTLDNIRATFGDFIVRPRFHILRGLAETFVQLDPAFRSHSKVKVGVKALPKRIILRSVGGFNSYGLNMLRDVINALAAFDGEPLVERGEFAELDKLHSYVDGHRAGEAQVRDLTIRKFQNGNAHVYFGPHALRSINRALAEFYGDVLPDAEGEEPEARPGTAVAKDLQFYPTPQAVIDLALCEIGLEKREEWNRDRFTPLRVLEPSCGDGRIMLEVARRGHRPFGFEVHAGRAAEARARGLPVVTANFLEQAPSPEFDLVVMNPPFYGRHYVRHVEHALRFLKPGGRLLSILPASAWYDHGELKGRWEDLPVAAFAESGTNIPTGMLIIAAPRA